MGSFVKMINHRKKTTCYSSILNPPNSRIENSKESIQQEIKKKSIKLKVVWLRTSPLKSMALALEANLKSSIHIVLYNKRIHWLITSIK